MKYKCSACKKTIEIEEGKLLPTLCPHCKAKFWEKPKNERILHTYQEKYLKERDELTLGKMAVIMQDIIHNLCIKKLRQSGSYNNEEDLEDVVYDSLLKILSYYRDKPDFLIEGSFVGYLSKVILYPLYNAKKKRRQQNEVSLSSEINKSGTGKVMTLQDRLATEHDTAYRSTEESFFESVQGDNILDSLSGFLEKVFKSIAKEQGIKHAILNWVFVNHNLDGRSDKFITSCLERYDDQTNTNYQNTLVLLKDYLMEETRIQPHDLE